MKIVLTENAKDILEKQNAEGTIWRVEKYSEADGKCELTVKHGQKQDNDEIEEVDGFKIAIPADIRKDYEQLTVDFNKGAYEGGFHIKAE
ncbi:MAG: hypothetical protein Q4P28_00135 [Tissierellia bacterium]|nr:hypothetical protein [Tissierellia bacterium]